MVVIVLNGAAFARERDVKVVKKLQHLERLFLPAETSLNPIVGCSEKFRIIDQF